MATHITRAEIADLTGYSIASLRTLMTRYPDRWPDSVGYITGPGGRIPLWDRDEILASVETRTLEGRRTGSSSTVSGDDGIIVCQVCGVRRRSLASHLRHAHAMTSDQYRKVFNLPATAALVSDQTRRESVERGLKRHEANPQELEERLAIYHSQEHMAKMTAAGREATVKSWANPIAREHRKQAQAGIEAACQRAAEIRNADSDAKARERGYEDMAHGIAETMHLSLPKASKVLGLSAAAIRRRRIIASGS